MRGRSPKPGETLGGKYLVKRVLGEGGMGTVFEAEHLRLRQAVAIKFLNPDMIGVDEVVHRFDREARAAATLKSRHVVRVMDVEATPEGVPYMVMELLDGADLEMVREQRHTLPHEEIIDYILQACDALAEAHDVGIVHRDLKPSNLFLTNHDDGVLVKVLDFGISKFLREDTKLTDDGTVMGTALYMSPEQIRGHNIDARSDVWALGVIMYELLAGSAPWTGPSTKVAAGIVSDPPPDIRPFCTIPEGLARVIEQLLEKRPSMRPASIAEVVQLLAPYSLPGGPGLRSIERIERRQLRGGISSGSMPIGPVSGPALEDARMAAAERSTMGAATLPNASRGARRAVLGLAGAAAGLAIIGGIALVGVTRERAQTAAAAAAGATGAAVPASAPVLPTADSVAIPVAAPSAATSSRDPSKGPSPTAAPWSARTAGTAWGGKPRSATPVVATATPPASPAPPPPARPADSPQPANPLFLK